MKVIDILRVKGNTLFTVPPEQSLAEATRTMAEMDIGSLVVMEHGDLVGMLTFREVIQAVVRNGGGVGTTIVSASHSSTSDATSAYERTPSSAATCSARSTLASWNPTNSTPGTSRRMRT